MTLEEIHMLYLFEWCNMFYGSLRGINGVVSIGNTED